MKLYNQKPSLFFLTQFTFYSGNNVKCFTLCFSVITILNNITQRDSNICRNFHFVEDQNSCYIIPC